MKGTLLYFELKWTICKTNYRLGWVKCNKPINLKTMYLVKKKTNTRKLKKLKNKNLLIAKDRKTFKKKRSGVKT